MAIEIEMEWPELGFKVVAVLLEDRNRSLCKVLSDNLPIETMQSHSVVAADQLYLCHDIVAFVEAEFSITYEDKKQYWVRCLPKR